MGFSLSWAALKNGSLEQICAAAGLHPAGRREETADSDMVAANLPSGWYLLLFNGNVIQENILEALSHSGEVVYCFIEDHVMFSQSSGWKSGRELWRVWHDGGEKGLSHLEIRGNLPADFTIIRQKLFAKQESAGGEKAGVEYVYHIPAEVAKALTGFRHD